MNINSVNRADSWADFVKIVHDARLRAQAPPVKTLPPASAVAKSGRIITPQPVRPEAMEAQGIVRSTTTFAKAQTRIAGIFFDTYA